MRVPFENEEINECWISDKDRFSYEGVNSAERLTKPMIKQGGQWQETDWRTALEYVAHAMRNIRHEHGADSVAAVAAPNSTLEELFLLQRIIRGIGSDNVDFRLRQSDFSLNGSVKPWLGTSITKFAQLKNVLSSVHSCGKTILCWQHACVSPSNLVQSSVCSMQLMMIC